MGFRVQATEWKFLLQHEVGRVNAILEYVSWGILEGDFAPICGIGETDTRIPQSVLSSYFQMGFWEFGEGEKNCKY